ncbi:MAG: hypothetical protein JXE07_02195 [Candidatus Aminicenantes bacterium]|nr:hypothetical protein [Candidatus Aminicenantes bacterium]
MSMQILSFNLFRTSSPLIFFLFPALFIVALLFPPLLLLIPAVIVSSLLSFRGTAAPVVVLPFSSSVRLPGLRSPPSSA